MGESEIGYDRRRAIKTGDFAEGDIDALLEENAKLKELVVQLSKLVIQHVTGLCRTVQPATDEPDKASAH